MFGANIMDGRFKTFTVDSLIQSQGSKLQEKFFVEVPYGVTSIEYFNLDSGNKELIVAGLDDGTIQILDYTKNKEKQSIQRPVFKIQKTEGSQAETRPADLDHPYDYFKESLYEHSAPVTSIEKNFKEPSIFATGGKDSNVFLWNLEGESEEVEFVTEINKSKLYKPGGSSLNQGYVTSLKWYNENVLALALTNGTL